MSTIQDLESRVLNRLEEDTEVFWVADELRPLIVEGFNEATLVTGDPQVRITNPSTLQTETNIQPMPPGALAVLRVEGTAQRAINKCTARDLDLHYPGWENATGPEIMFWFPIGLTAWGVYPQLTEPQQVMVTIVQIPVPTPRPYTGNEIMPFNEEFLDGFVEYTEHVARLKESGKEFQQGMPAYQRWMDKLQDMTKFAVRKDRLRFLRPGVVSQFTNVKEV